MRNQAMRRKLEVEDAIDVEKISAPMTDAEKANPQLAGAFKLDRLQFVEERDYCVGSTEQWIWSIGQAPDGALFAALDTRFYQNPGFECRWLR